MSPTTRSLPCQLRPREPTEFRQAPLEQAADTMTPVGSADIGHPIACTLDTAALGNREDEFRTLFGRALRSIDRRDRRWARLELDAASETETRDLLAREQRCCSFFDFTISVADERLVVDVRAPRDAESAVDFLLALAPPHLPSHR